MAEDRKKFATCLHDTQNHDVFLEFIDRANSKTNTFELNEAFQALTQNEIANFFVDLQANLNPILQKLASADENSNQKPLQQVLSFNFVFFPLL